MSESEKLIEKLATEVSELRYMMQGRPGNGRGVRGEIEDMARRIAELERLQRERTETKKTILHAALEKVVGLAVLGVLVAVIFYVKAPTNSLTGGNVNLGDRPLEAISSSTPKIHLSVRDLIEDYAYRTGETVNGDTVRRWIAEGRIQPPPVKKGRVWMIDPDYRIVPK